MDRSATEAASRYQNLDAMSAWEIVNAMNKEDWLVAQAVGLVKGAVARLAEAAYEKMVAGGRMFYLGAGTAGRLGVLDASECPPTFNMPPDRVIGLIAGGDRALRTAVEGAEDRLNGWDDLSGYNVTNRDIVIGISASGGAKYVLRAIEACNDAGVETGCITSNPKGTLARIAKHPVAVEVGPEFLSGSSRLKSGTAQKMILNMLSTAVACRLGYVRGNKMTRMRATNEKLTERAVAILRDDYRIDEREARSLIEQFGSVESALASRHVSLPG